MLWRKVGFGTVLAAGLAASAHIKSPVFRSQLTWAAVGGLLGNLTQPAVNQTFDSAWKVVCPIDEWLTAGRRARREAVTIQDAFYDASFQMDDALQAIVDRKHKDANAAFERAAACTSELAKAHLGMAYCFGFGLPRDRQKGELLIYEAAEKSLAVKLDWSNRSELCPASLDGTAVVRPLRATMTW